MKRATNALTDDGRWLGPKMKLKNARRPWEYARPANEETEQKKYERRIHAETIQRG